MGAVARETGGLLWDDETREMFTIDAWSARAAAAAVPAADVSALTSIHAYRDGDLIRIVTLGMRKLGLPDVVVNDVPKSFVPQMTSLVQLVCQTIFESDELERPGQLPVRLDAIAAPEFAESFEVQDGARGRAELTLAMGTHKEGDPDNRLVEIVFPGPRSSLHERQDAVLTAMWGKTNEVLGADPDDRELRAASRRARRELLALKPRFQPAPPAMESLSVKAPFETPSGSLEWMWVEVVRWERDTIHGILMNAPREVPGLHQGALVKVADDSVFDYVHRSADGTLRGDETSEILQRRK